MKFSVTKNGKALDKSLYSWNEDTITFSSKEEDLTLDFHNINYITFNTGSNCVFNTGSNCVFNTGSYCIFNTGFHCDIKTGTNSVIIRKDIFEVIVLNKKENHIKLNDYFDKGYKVIKNKHIITIDGKDIELSEQSYNNLKEQLK